jgi:hypothetical protein
VERSRVFTVSLRRALKTTVAITLALGSAMAAVAMDHGVVSALAGLLAFLSSPSSCWCSVAIS